MLYFSATIGQYQRYIGDVYGVAIALLHCIEAFLVQARLALLNNGKPASGVAIFLVLS